MATRTHKPKVETETIADDEEFAESFQSDGGIASELPARYRNHGSSFGKGLGFTIFLLVLIAAGYFGYRYFSKTNSTLPTSVQEQQETFFAADGVAFTPTTTPTPTAALSESDTVFSSADDADTPPVLPAAPLILEIRNGTTTPGLAKQVADSITDPQVYKVAKVGNAARTTYPKTLIVIMGKQIDNATAAALAATLKADVTAELPSGEPASTSDILIILGKDAVTGTP